MNEIVDSLLVYLEATGLVIELKMIRCNICKKTFRKDNLTRHIKSVHENEKLNCKNCNVACSTKGALTRHLKFSCPSQRLGNNTIVMFQ